MKKRPASVAGLDESVEKSPQAKPCPKFVNKSNFLLGGIVGTWVKVCNRFRLSNNLLGSFNSHKKKADVINVRPEQIAVDCFGNSVRGSLSREHI